MEFDTTKLEEVVLALLYFNAHTDHGVTRAWKGSTGTRWIGCTPRFHLNSQVEGQVGGPERRRGAEGGGVIQEVLCQSRITGRFSRRRSRAMASQPSATPRLSA